MNSVEIVMFRGESKKKTQNNEDASYDIFQLLMSSNKVTIH